MRNRAAVLALMIAIVAAAVTAAPLPALAHPHVWVTMRSELDYAPDGALTAVRHAWTFDDAFSSYALQGLDAGPDGKPTEATLKSLAQVNVDSLKEFGYFTTAKRGKQELAFKPPIDYSLSYDGTALTLHFTLPLDKPAAKGAIVTIDVYDPTYFVAFELADTDPVSLAGAPAGCRLDLHRPDPAAASMTNTTTLAESFFSSLTASSTFGSQFANRVTVACS